MKRETLKADKRTTLGKKVRFLRREGILPANIFGKDMKSLSIQLPLKDFESIYKIVHETGLVDLSVEKDTYPVLIQNIQIHPITHTPIHADFFKVNLKEKVKASIPVVAVGEPKAVADKIGVLLQPLSEIEIEALPTDLPENVEVNVENLSNIDDSITVGDIKTPNGVEIITEASELIFRIGELVSEEAEELAAEEEAEAKEASEESAEAPEKAGDDEAKTDTQNQAENDTSKTAESNNPEEKTE